MFSPFPVGQAQLLRYERQHAALPCFELKLCRMSDSGSSTFKPPFSYRFFSFVSNKKHNVSKQEYCSQRFKEPISADVTLSSVVQILCCETSGSFILSSQIGPLCLISNSFGNIDVHDSQSTSGSPIHSAEAAGSPQDKLNFTDSYQRAC